MPLEKQQQQQKKRECHFLLPRRLFWGGVIIVFLSFWTQFQPVYVGRGGFPTPTAHNSPGHHMGVLQFNSVLTLPTWSQVPDMKGLPPETVPPPNSESCASDQPLQRGGSHKHLLGLARAAHRTKRSIYLLDHQFIVEDCNSEQPDARDA